MADETFHSGDPGASTTYPAQLSSQDRPCKIVEMSTSESGKHRHVKHNLSTTMADEDFNSGNSGASRTYPVTCSSLRKNGFVMIKDRPCKIVEMSTSKTGKHGHAKVHLVGLDIFTAKKCEDICPSTHNLDVPIVLRKEYDVICVVDGYLTLMNDAGDTREDLKVPDGKLGEEIIEKLDLEESVGVTVLEAIGEEHVISCKNTK